MSCTVQIMLPTVPTYLKPVYFKGYVNHTKINEISIYITKFCENNIVPQNTRDETDTIYGYCDNSRPPCTVQSEKCNNHFTLQYLNNKVHIKELIINGNNINFKDQCIIVFYDYERIRDSEVKLEYSDNLYKLQYLVQSENSVEQSVCSDEAVIYCPTWLTSSMFIQHIVNYLNIVHWLFNTIQRNRKISIKQGNLILAIVMDLILGYIALQYLTQDKSELSSLLMGLLEKLINMLYTLLKWLMGAPAGLKLNNAFNKMLGKYFSYHVQLWWLFLDVSGEKLDTILHIYSYLGYLGFTFQAAVISDMICIATFHSYCIYVYAARMFNIQISGLIALLRFFVGRKYNPLRGGIDSCEYTNQELFVGTVAFTILLLLLPTTLMYYAVFTVFRILSLLVQYTLAKLIYYVHTFPLYVGVLWLLQSPRVAGNVLLEVVDQETSHLTIRLKLQSKSFIYLINNFSPPPVEIPTPLQWKNFVSNVLIGKQIL